ncbi:MAG: serine hydrolase domain-containing protein [Acidobacteriota bacterium]
MPKLSMLLSSPPILLRFGVAAVLVSATACNRPPPIPAPPATGPETEAIELFQGLYEPWSPAGDSPGPMRLMERLEHYGVPGVQIAVIDGGELRFSKAWGLAEGTLEDGRTMTPEIRMQAASIAKLFAATAALRHAGTELDVLDSEVGRFGDGITPRHLLSHTSGLGPGGFPGYGRGEPTPTFEQILAGEPPANHAAVAPVIPPGQEWRYSGGGYLALEDWIQRQTGRDFAEFLQDEIFAPLEMVHTGFDEPDDDALAPGHTRDGERLDGDFRVHPERAAAGLWTTAGDLAAWVVDLQKAQAGKPNRRVKRVAALAMLEPQEPGGWGLGPILGGDGHATYFGHLGGNAGYRGFVLGFKSSGHGAVILANGDNGFALIREIISGLAVIYNWPTFQPQEREVVTLDAEALDAVAGHYAVAAIPGAALELLVEGDALRLRGFGEDVELYPVSENLFFDRAQGFEIVIKTRTDDDRADGIELRTFPAYRFAASRVEAPQDPS